jgi:phenylpropionate dioxygenase-like ring-hydroxylating dioxygenase large terminal subunit
MDFKMFWYVIGESKELKPGTVLERQVLGESLALFRDKEGKAVAFQNRCLHRNAPLSIGKVRDGRLQCSYHGWTYEGSGRVVEIPSMGSCRTLGDRCAKTFSVCEKQGYIYVNLSDSPLAAEPFNMSHYGENGWRHRRVTNLFKNTVTNCAENFVDIPHTAYVHPVIFRSRKNEKLGARIHRKNGEVHISYENEKLNLGTFSKFLNTNGMSIKHTDSFYMPNITSVEYFFGPNRHLYITSQSVPISDEETLVYTDMTFNYGIWNPLAGFFVERHGQKIIDQDIEILKQQMRVIKRYGERFSNTPSDLIHVFIESIRQEIREGRDPRLLPEKSEVIEFWV